MTEGCLCFPPPSSPTLICSLLIIQMAKMGVSVKRALIWSFIIITITVSIQRRHPGLPAPVGAASPRDSSSTLHKGPAVNHRTRDPGPVLAERELLLRGFGSRPWPPQTSRVGSAPHTPVCRKQCTPGQRERKKNDVCGNLQHMGRNVETRRSDWSDVVCLRRVQHRAADNCSLLI